MTLGRSRASLNRYVWYLWCDRRVRKVECSRSICELLIISLATTPIDVVKYSHESTHWLYSVPSGRLTRETFRSAWLGPTTRTLQAYPTEEKCAMLVQPVVVRIVSSFKQLFMLRSRLVRLAYTVLPMYAPWNWRDSPSDAFTFLSF